VALASPAARAERAGTQTLDALRPALASAYRADRVEAIETLDLLARDAPGQRAEWLADPDPAVRRAAARLLARSPDPALEGAVRDAFLREQDPAVRHELVFALLGLPGAATALEPAVKAARDPELDQSYARLVRTVAVDALVTKVRNGRVPGFYDGQFTSVWGLAPSMSEELLAIAYDDASHLVVRILAVMALHETRRPTLEQELAGLIQSEDSELEAMWREARPFRRTVIEILRQRPFTLSKYVRFSLAKAGQTAAIRRLIHRVDEFIAEPEQQRLLAFRGGIDEGRPFFEAEVLRELMFDVGYYFQQFDDYAAAEARYRELLRRYPESRACQNAHYNLACICAIQGRRREALDHLHAAIQAGFTDHRWLLEDGDLTSLRDDPEFQALVELARSGLVDDAGRDWMRELQRFLPPGTRSLFDLPPDRQEAILTAAKPVLTPAQRRRIAADAPPEQRPRIAAALGTEGGGP
jgi:tetratricopeptide (TPR) repeat protein